jgi:Xaa-Pro aminopeptidase
MAVDVGLVDGRRDRLAAMLSDRSLAAVWLARPNNFAWLVGGDNAVDRSADVGVAAAGYDGEEVRVVTDDIEADRLVAEQLPAAVRVETYEWHAGALPAAVAERSPRPAAADFDVPGLEPLDASDLRQPLTDGDVERYRDLGATVAAALEAACRAAAPDDAECDVAADLRARLARAGISAPVTLVGGDERARAYRHFTPTDASIGEYALVSVTAERGGLFASATRTVAFDAPGWLRDRHRAACRVEATALAATRAVGRAGGTAADVFAAIRDAYEAVGWTDEWREHHQGGAAGFAGREWIATPDSEAAVRLPIAAAWNPTVRGAKSEGTVLVEAAGYEPLTPGRWPTVEVEAVGYDERLDRPGVLAR